MNDDRRHNQENGARGGLPLDALLSAYLDDRESLTAEETARVETLLATDAEARRMYAELQVVVRELGRLEPVAAPRSYHLDAEMVGAPEPVQITATRAWYVRHAGAVRWATAAAAVLFVFVLSADLVLNGIFADSSSDGNDAGSVPVEQSQLTGPAQDEAAPETLSGAAEAEDTVMTEEAAGGDAADDDASDGSGELAVPPGQAEEEAEEESAGAADQANDAEEEGEAQDEAGDELTPAPVPTAEIAIAEEDAPETDAAPDDTARTSEAPEAADDEAAAPDMFAVEDESAEADDDADRRIWRIAEFSLVVILALLITAMIILPRMARAPNRR